MKKPSRYLPKYTEKPTGILEWVFLAFLLSLLGWLIWLIPYLLLLVPVFIVMDIWIKRKRKNHFNILLKDRQKDSICTFSRYFEFRKIDTWVIRAVYEQLQNYMNPEKEKFSYSTI